MAAYYVSGDGDPSPNGYYGDAGEYESARYYERLDGGFDIWLGFGGGAYCLSLETGQGAPGWWEHLVEIVGTYTPGGTYTGNPVVVPVPDGAGSLLGVGR